ncbi:hypothetical protein [Stratiformator vulcanicus]|uniref:Uncharacterized protein n=1 Tax=Stratiformator vulcanicus TaxID=2527980 RepID=A0A517R1F5_9PLAN|nr:hypothetical protein [Stratiformator vulcanicus]QDT37717.1 hypothetical protein Pan189_20990 [Stratiformator vulcanicus]
MRCVAIAVAISLVGAGAIASDESPALAEFDRFHGVRSVEDGKPCVDCKLTLRVATSAENSYFTSGYQLFDILPANSSSLFKSPSIAQAKFSRKSVPIEGLLVDGKIDHYSFSAVLGTIEEGSEFVLPDGSQWTAQKIEVDAGGVEFNVTSPSWNFSSDEDVATDLLELPVDSSITILHEESSKVWVSKALFHTTLGVSRRLVDGRFLTDVKISVPVRNESAAGRKSVKRNYFDIEDGDVIELFPGIKRVVKTVVASSPSKGVRGKVVIASMTQGNGS